MINAHEPFFIARSGYVRRSVRLGIAVALLLGITLTPQPTASAAPTYSDGDCWRAGAPWWCTKNWSPNSSIPVLVVDQISAAVPGFAAPLRAAISAWNSAAGPQVLSLSHQTNEISFKYILSSTGSHGLTAGVEAITESCYTDAICYESTYPASNILIT